MAHVLVAIAVLAIAAYVALESRAAARRLSAALCRRARRALLAVLGLAGVLAVGTYVDFGLFRYGTYLNEWDFYHYYVGTKYAPELRYTNLYGATLLADVEGGLRYRNPRGEIRDLATARLRSVMTVATEAQRYRSRFSESRWREFVADITWFKQQLPPQRWSLILADHGYNGTPAWSFVAGGLLTRHLSVREPLSRWLMLLLDPLLLLATVAAVGWAFGLRAAWLVVIFIGTHYLFSWGHLKGALLRTDFAMGSLLAVCLVKQGRYKLAGVLLGWAILSRVFPAFLLIGPAVLLAHGLWRRRQLDRRLAGFFVACGATIVVLVLASSAYFGGFGIWREWSAKLALHYADGSDWDLGLRTILEATFVDGVPVREASLALAGGQTPVSAIHPAEIVTLLLLALPALTFVRALEHHEALAYGFVFVFLFSIAAYYYYLILCVPLVFFASDLGKPAHALGAAFLFLVGSFGYVLFGGWEPLRQSWSLFRGWHQSFPTYYYSSCLLGVTVVQMVALAGLRARRLERASRAGIAVR
ncbi:MAG: hypothetical protein JXP73_19485 [Deltaproteobacteria bacterium]|nr:hypothetical protein [Deltaproteobacteria bacterium]